MLYVFIGLGGMVGSLLRYLVSIMGVHLWGDSFPFGTLIVNITGAFFLGLLTRKYSMTGKLSSPLVLAIGTGAIGSFTTMSSLSTETVFLIEKSSYLSTFLYIIMSMVGGLSAAFIGYKWNNKLNKDGKND